MAGLIDSDRRKVVYKQNLMEFLEHGLHYVFPVEPGKMENGLYTAHSHPYMREQIKSESLAYVWPDPRGDVRGLAIEPLYQRQVKAAQQDGKLYLMLALLDVIRVGRVREFKIAIAKLRELLA